MFIGVKSDIQMTECDRLQSKSYVQLVQTFRSDKVHVCVPKSQVRGVSGSSLDMVKLVTVEGTVAMIFGVAGIGVLSNATTLVWPSAVETTNNWGVSIGFCFCRTYLSERAARVGIAAISVTCIRPAHIQIDCG